MKLSIRKIFRLFGITTALLLLVFISNGYTQVLPGPPVEITVPIAPTPFKRDGKINLVYEVHITNFSQNTLLLTKAEVLGDKAGTEPIASYTDKEITESLVRPVPALKLLDARMIESGKRGVLYLWVQLDNMADIPQSLHHRLFFKPLGGGGNEQPIDGAIVAVSKQQAPVLGPPVHGNGWAARFLSNNASHRRSMVPVGGRAIIQQRFAIDFSKLGEDWKYARGEGSKNSDAYGYGQEILAVADGVVANIKDGIPENDPSTPSGVLPNTWDTIYGNFLVLDIGNGNYAYYAHIQPDSFRVKVGDRVKRGQVVALVGNSGNATGPHLHFQVCNSNEMLHAEGLPYVFDSFEVLGTETLDQFLNGDWKPDPNFKAKRYEREMTPDMTIVRFP